MIMFTVLNAFIRKKVFKKVNHTTERSGVWEDKKGWELRAWKSSCGCMRQGGSLLWEKGRKRCPPGAKRRPFQSWRLLHFQSNVIILRRGEEVSGMCWERREIWNNHVGEWNYRRIVRMNTNVLSLRFKIVNLNWNLSSQFCCFSLALLYYLHGHM